MDPRLREGDDSNPVSRTCHPRASGDLNEKAPVKDRGFFSCFTWTRTKDNAINSRGLYQLSYEASFCQFKSL